MGLFHFKKIEKSKIQNPDAGMNNWALIRAMTHEELSGLLDMENC